MEAQMRRKSVGKLLCNGQTVTADLVINWANASLKYDEQVKAVLNLHYLDDDA
jgi:hypothetical protein